MSKTPKTTAKTAPKQKKKQRCYVRVKGDMREGTMEQEEARATQLRVYRFFFNKMHREKHYLSKLMNTNTLAKL